MCFEIYVIIDIKYVICVSFYAFGVQSAYVTERQGDG